MVEDRHIETETEDRNATVRGPYPQRSIKARMEAFFLENLGKVATREQLIEVATDPQSGRIPENWHQRLSELRTDDGYTILSWRNRGHHKARLDNDRKINSFLA